MKIITVIVAVLLITGGVIAGWGYITLKSKAVAKQGDIYIEESTDADRLQDMLEREGYINNISRLANASRLLGFHGTVKAGRYVLDHDMDYMQVVRTFQRGLQTPVRVTFNNIRLLPQLAGRVSQQIRPDSLSLVQVMLADTTPGYYGFTKEDFIAMFIPDTYEMYWTVTPTGFLDRMKREYDRFWTNEREQKAADIGLTRAEVVTLASIVYEETKMSDEMPAVAGVYINRLNKRMRLEADPTVKFAMGDFALKRMLTRYTKEVDSPYNTYMYGGLPPGPICMPSVKAIDAVLDYQRHDYIFFCARPDFSGYHNFAVTNAQHERNRAAWVAALNKAGIR